MKLFCTAVSVLCICSITCFSALTSAQAPRPAAAPCPDIVPERLAVLQAFLLSPSEGLNTSVFVEGVYGAFAPDATLIVPETGDYVGVEDIAEYALVTNGDFNNGTFTAQSFTIDPRQVVVGSDWIQVRALINKSRRGRQASCNNR